MTIGFSERTCEHVDVAAFEGAPSDLVSQVCYLYCFRSSNIAVRREHAPTFWALVTTNDNVLQVSCFFMVMLLYHSICINRIQDHHLLFLFASVCRRLQ